MDSLGGKILRLTPEGEVPGDNPFGNNPVWAYGLRNPQGIAWDEDENLYVSDHGPTGEYGLCCHDELNLVTPGGFYGWPLRAGERDAAPPGEVAVDDEPIDPIAESGPANTWAPSGIAFVPGERRGSVAMANLRGEHLRRFVIGDDPARVRDQRVAVEGLGRLRTAALGPDGFARIARLAPEGMPVIGIGGITASHAPSIIAAGAVGVAVIGAVLGAADPEAAARNVLAQWGSKA